MKQIALSLLILLTGKFAIAQNPICPSGLNIADPTARVWKDGKLYVYGSRDESLDYYCSYDHWVLSTSDLINWEYTYKYLDFGDGATSVSVRVAPGAKPGKIQFKLDNSWGAPYGTLDVPGGGDGKTWTTLTCKIKEMKGVRALHLAFSGEEKESFNVDWFKFEK